MKITVTSVRGLTLHPSRCYDYEFENVLVDVAGATLLDLSAIPTALGAVPAFMDGLFRTVGFERRKMPKFVSDRVAPDQDLFVMNCQMLDDLHVLNGVPNWRSNSRFAVCWIKELFAKGPHPVELLRILDRFDLVILNFEGSVEYLRKQMNRAAVMHLPLGIDAVQFCPFPRPPRPVIDVYWMGRIAPAHHHALQTEAERNGLFYMFNSTWAENVTEPREHRVLRSRLIKHTALFGVQPAKFNEPEVVGKQSEIGFRYFEGAAAGAALIGHAARAPSFDEIFPWDDAVIEMPDAADELVPFIRDLLAQRDRLERIRRDSVTHCLTHHDWLYRLYAIFDQLALPTDSIQPALDARQGQLQALAAEAARGRLGGMQAS
ncbi:MAG: glycosyltransferase [Planctomycetes bacterium]|nr:glycosyltransferase [Planctomycetota bacterium]MCB9870656.1 glycosyltransferase [Planctomycetota bacterium]